MALLRFFLLRLLATLPVAFCVVMVTSLLMQVIPGDPIDHMLGDFATLEQKNTLRAQLHLDIPPWEQILHYFKNLLSGDLGSSLIYNKPVATLILERMPATIELACLAILIAIVVGVSLGTLGALYKDKWIDFVAMFFSMIFVSMPNFWLGPLLILLFSLHWNLLPVSERGGVLSYVLPSATIGIALAAFLSRFTRDSVLEQMGSGYIRTAKAKGLSKDVIFTKHILKNVSIPIVTVVGLQFGTILTGAVITEKIFDWPGLGTLIIDALGQRDYPLIQGCLLVFSLIHMLVNLVTDLIYSILDPRVGLQ